MKRTFLALIALTLAAYAQPGTLKLIVPGVWFREGDQKAFGHSNNIIIEMKDHLIVVDANYPSGAQAVIDDVKKISAKPIRYVIDTHHHQDHSYGNALFTRIGATTIAYAGAYEEMRRYEPQNWQRNSKVRKDVRDLNLPVPEPPQLLYTTSPYAIGDSTRRVELYHFGPGHTRGDTFVYLPKEKILCTGDAVPDGPHNDPKNAFIKAWPDEVRAAQKLDVKYVLPGHGKAGGKELLEYQIQFLLSLYNTVDEAIKGGKTLEQLVTLRNGQAVATSIRLPEKIMDMYVFHGPDLQPWQVARFPTQVLCTYQEITQGRPYGEIAGGK